MIHTTSANPKQLFDCWWFFFVCMWNETCLWNNRCLVTVQTKPPHLELLVPSELLQESRSPKHSAKENSQHLMAVSTKTSHYSLKFRGQRGAKGDDIIFCQCGKLPNIMSLTQSRCPSHLAAHSWLSGDSGSCYSFVVVNIWYIYMYWSD